MSLNYISIVALLLYLYGLRMIIQDATRNRCFMTYTEEDEYYVSIKCMCEGKDTETIYVV